MSKTLLPIVAAADNFLYLPPVSTWTTPKTPPTPEVYIPFHLTAADYKAGLSPIGLLRPSVFELLCPNLSIGGGDGSSGSPMQAFCVVREGNNVAAVYLDPWVIEQNRIDEVLNDLADEWRFEELFPGPLGGWRDERYTIFADKRSSIFSSSSRANQPLGNAAFNIERAACALFGLRTIGVHMTAYEGEGKDMKIWVPRRSATKATWPSYLDNSVAGGIPAGMRPFDSMIKECDEEASMPEEFVRKYMRQTGAVTYFYITDDGWLQPELEYTYDLQLPPQDSPDYRRPKPHDDEVESFALLTIPQVMEALHNGEFKPNCGLILVDFLIRHNLVSPETEPNFFEIIWRTKRDLDSSVTLAAGTQKIEQHSATLYWNCSGPSEAGTA